MHMKYSLNHDSPWNTNSSHTLHERSWNWQDEVFLSGDYSSRRSFVPTQKTSSSTPQFGHPTSFPASTKSGIATPEISRLYSFRWSCFLFLQSVEINLVGSIYRGISVSNEFVQCKLYLQYMHILQMLNEASVCKHKICQIGVVSESFVTQNNGTLICHDLWLHEHLYLEKD